MMRYGMTLLIASALAVPTVAKAQMPTKTSPAQDSVMAVVKQLFDGMRTRDTMMIRGTFAPGTVLGGVPAAGRPVRFTTVDAFLGGLNGAPVGTLLDEQIYDPEVRIDGGLATVWTFYTFSLGETLSHCGMDAFQLARTSAGWKIIALADTRQTTGCDVTGKTKA